jgi:hypothetical protein
LGRRLLMPLRALLVAFIVLLIISLPYVFAARLKGTEHVFAGFLLNPLDGNSYLAKMYQGWRGEWRFTLAYTAHSGDGVYLFFTFYLALGHIARFLGLPLILVFHIARLLCAALMLFALWRFLHELRPDGRWPVLTYALASLGLGMGWLIFLSGYIPSDFWVAEAYPFLSAYISPHFSLGLACMFWLVSSSISWRASSAGVRFWPRGLGQIALALILGFVSPFGVVIILAALAGLLAWDSFPSRQPHHEDFAREGTVLFLKEWLGQAVHSPLLASLVWIALGGLPVPAYQIWVVHIHPVLAGWNAQNLTWTPAVWDVFLSFSPALLMGLVGAWVVVRQRRLQGRVLVVWGLMVLFLIYLPFSLQRRFLTGIYAVPAVLSGYGLDFASQRSKKWGRRLAALTFGLSLPTTILVLMIGFFGMLKQAPLLYLTQGESQALQWIEANTPTHALVLASPEMGMFIPAHTGRQVIYGHPFETVNAIQEETTVKNFFNGQMSSPQAFLAERGVDYIFIGPRERLLGSLPSSVALKQVYEAAGVSIFHVEGSQ